jgi:hypothetical protein
MRDASFQRQSIERTTIILNYYQKANLSSMIRGIKTSEKIKGSTKEY